MERVAKHWEWAAQGDAGVTIPECAQETTGHGHGLVDTVKGGPNDLKGFFPT